MQNSLLSAPPARGGRMGGARAERPSAPEGRDHGTDMTRIAAALLALALLAGARSAPAADLCALAPSKWQQEECRRTSLPTLKGVEEANPGLGQPTCRTSVDSAIQCCRQQIRDEDSPAFRACVRDLLTDPAPSEGAAEPPRGR